MICNFIVHTPANSPSEKNISVVDTLFLCNLLYSANTPYPRGENIIAKDTFFLYNLPHTPDHPSPPHPQWRKHHCGGRSFPIEFTFQFRSPFLPSLRCGDNITIFLMNLSYSTKRRIINVVDTFFLYNLLYSANTSHPGEENIIAKSHHYFPYEFIVQHREEDYQCSGHLFPIRFILQSRHIFIAAVMSFFYMIYPTVQTFSSPKKNIIFFSNHSPFQMNLFRSIT